MRHLRHTLNKQLIRKKLDRHALGAIAVNVVRDFFVKSERRGGKFRPSEVEGYVKFHTIFIQTSSQELCIQLRLCQSELLQLVNKKLGSLGFRIKMQMIRSK